MQLVLGIAMFVVSAVLAWITWIYMNATKRMADSIDIQSKIMQREFELRISPIVSPSFHMSTTDSERVKYRFFLSNAGQYAVRLVGIALRFRHKTDEGIAVPSLDIPYDLLINPSSSPRITFEVDFSHFGNIRAEGRTIDCYLMQPVFIVVNAEDKRFEFLGSWRSMT